MTAPGYHHLGGYGIGALYLPTTSSRSIPFDGGITAEAPTCALCTWVYRHLDGGYFMLKYRNLWCPVKHG